MCPWHAAAGMPDSLTSLRAGAEGLPSHARSLLSFDKRAAVLFLAIHWTYALLELRRDLSTTPLPWFMIGCRVAALLITAAPMASTFLARPTAHLRWRNTLYVAVRVLYFTIPSLRMPTGSFYRTLGVDPTPGAVGWMKEMLGKCYFACRLLSVMPACLALPVPLHLHILLQLYAVVVVRSNRTTCRAHFFTHPLTVDRIATVHSIMQFMATLLVPAGGLAMIGQCSSNEGGGECPPALVPAAQVQQCEAYLHFLSAVVALPLSIAAVIRLQLPNFMLSAHSSRGWKGDGMLGSCVQWLIGTPAMAAYYQATVPHSVPLHAMAPSRSTAAASASASDDDGGIDYGDDVQGLGPLYSLPELQDPLAEAPAAGGGMLVRVMAWVMLSTMLWAASAALA